MANRPTDQATDQPAAPPVPAAARRQAELIRDEWLAPLIAQIREQAETIGRLEAERAAMATERDRLLAERDSDRRLADRLVDLLQAERDEARAEVERLREASQIRLEPPEAEGPPCSAAEASMPRWRRRFRRMVEGA